MSLCVKCLVLPLCFCLPSTPVRTCSGSLRPSYGVALLGHSSLAAAGSDRRRLDGTSSTKLLRLLCAGYALGFLLNRHAVSPGRRTENGHSFICFPAENAGFWLPGPLAPGRFGPSHEQSPVDGPSSSALFHNIGLALRSPINVEARLASATACVHPSNSDLLPADTDF